MFLTTFLISISSSLDALGMGITYGLTNLKLSNLSKLILYINLLILSTISILLGNYIKSYIPVHLTNLLGCFLIIFIGLFTTIKNIVSIKTRYKSFDFDNSNDIRIRETLFLSLLLSCNNICIGIIAGIIRNR